MLADIHLDKNCMAVQSHPAPDLSLVPGTAGKFVVGTDSIKFPVGLSTLDLLTYLINIVLFYKTLLVHKVQTLFWR